jgi:hypothetical protein
MNEFHFHILGNRWGLEATNSGVKVFKGDKYITTIRMDFIEELQGFLKSVLEKEEE